MKRRLLKSADSNIAVAIQIIEDINATDRTSRKKAKRSTKKKWSRSINVLNKALKSLHDARKYVKSVPRRV